MVLMVSSGLRMSRVVAALKKTPDWPNMRQCLWETLTTQTDHATWARRHLSPVPNERFFELSTCLF
jgi:hypothetical protein